MSNIHYGLSKKSAAVEEYDDSALKSDIATLKSDLLAEKLKVSTNKTNISILTAAKNTAKTDIATLKTSVNTLNSQVTTVENTATANTTKATAAKTKADSNETAIALRPKSITTYFAHIPDLSSTYQTSVNVPNQHWPYPLISFGTPDANTAFRLINVTFDEDVVIPSTFNVSYMLKAYTTATGSHSEGTVATLNLGSFRIPNKPFYNINRDYRLSAIFPTNYARLGCAELYLKHNHGAASYHVETVTTCAIVQF